MMVVGGAGCACAVYWGVVWRRSVRVGRRLPTARSGLAMGTPEGGWPRVCVIVPAHNERDVIGYVGSSLAAQEYPFMRCVFVLDRCTDDTEEVLRAAVMDQDGGLDARFEVIVNESCPEGWSGKTHAMWRGYRDSAGAREAEVLLFLDADTELDVGALRATVALMEKLDVGLLSLLNTLSVEQWYERVVQPAAGLELVRQFPLDDVNDPEKERTFANGQFMMFRRAAYERFGGHEAVKDAVLEDLAIAKMWGRKKRGEQRAAVLMADGMVLCRMYRDWGAFRRGWRRIYTEAASRRVERLRSSATALVATGVVLPACAAASVVCGVAAWWVGDGVLAAFLVAAGCAGVVAMVGALWCVYGAQHTARRWMVWYPVGAWRTAGILREAARDLVRGRATEWGGKSYVREAR